MPGPVSFDAWTLDIDISPAFAKLKSLASSAKNIGRQIAENLTKPVMTQFSSLPSVLNKRLASKIKPTIRNLQAQFEWLKTGKGALELSIETKKAKAALDGFEGALRSFWAKVQHYLTFTIGVQLVMRSVRALEQSINLFTEFEKSAAMAASVSGYLGESFATATKTIEDFARRIGRKTVYSAEEVANAMYSIASAGYDIKQFTEEEFLPILNYATSQSLELNDAVEQVIRTFKEFKDQGETNASIVDKFTAAITSSFLNARRLAEGLKYVGAMAGSVGLSLDETLAALATLVDRGYEGSQAGQRLNMILTRLLKPTREGEKVLQRLGLTIADIDPRVHSLTEILYKLRAAGFSAADAAQMFRARTAAAALTLIENADAVGIFAGRISAAQGLTEELAEKQMQTLWGALRHLSNILKDTAISLGQFLKPAIIGIADAIENYLLPFINAMTAPLRALSTIFSGFGKGSRIVIGGLIAIGASFAGLILTLKLFGKLFRFLPSQFFDAAVSANTFRTAIDGLRISAAYAVNSLTGLSLSTQTVSQALRLTLLSSAALASAFYFDLPSAVSGTIASFSTLYIILGTLRNRVLSLREALALIGGVAITATAAGIAQSAESLQDKLVPGLIAVGSSAFNTYLMFRLLGISLKSLLGPIGILLTVAQVLVSVFGDEIRNAIKNLGKTLGIIPSEIDKMYERLPEATSAIEDLVESLDKWAETTKRIAELRKEINAYSGNIDDLSSKMELLNRLNKEQGQYQLQIFQSWSKLASVSSKMTEGIATDVKLIGEWIDLHLQQEKLLRRSEELNKDNKKALEEFGEAVLKYGAQSEEAMDAWNRFLTTGDDYSEVLGQIDELKESINEKELEHKDNLEKLTAKEREYVQTLWDLADKYVKAISLMDQLTEYYAKLNTLAHIRSNINTILSEKFADLADSEKKILDIEEKLYKLRHDSVKRVRNLWDALTKEGWVTDELIEGRKELEQSYGEMMKAQIKFAHLMDRLTPEQQRQLTEWLASYQEAVEAGITPPSPPEFLSQDQASIATEYAEAIMKYRDAIARLESYLSTFVDQLVQSDLVSSDLIDEFYDLIGAAHEIASSSNKLEKALDSQGDKFESVIETIWNYWNSVYDSSEETRDMESAFMEAARGLGIFTDALGNSDRMLQYIRDVLNDQTITWDTLSSEQAVAALTIGKVSSAYLGLYRTVSGNQIIDLIPGVDSWDGFKKAVEDAKDKAVPNISEIQQKIKDLEDQLIGISKEWEVKLDYVVTIKQKIEIETNKDLEKVLPKKWVPVTGPLGVPILVPEDWLTNGGGPKPGVVAPGEVGNLPVGQFGGLIRGPTLLLAGEKGPELLLPLTKPERTARLLSTFLPRYLPELAGQYGGLYTPRAPIITEDRSESWVIAGPIYVQTVRDAEEFVSELKFRARSVAP